MLTAAALAASAQGCTNACDALADQICGCAANLAEENSCLESVRSSRAIHVPSQAEIDACTRALDTCTCAKLEDDDAVACGLAK